jgi:hypothetical protein
MGSQKSRPGRRVITGWGVEVRFPGHRRFHRLKRPIPGVDNPEDRPDLCMSLKAAQAWAEDWIRRGCEARVVQLENSRGSSFRERAKPEGPAAAKTGWLF